MVHTYIVNEYRVLITELTKHRPSPKQTKAEFPKIPLSKDKHFDVKFPIAPPLDFFNLAKKLEYSIAQFQKPYKEGSICVIGAIQQGKKSEAPKGFTLEVLIHAAVEAVTLNGLIVSKISRPVSFTFRS